VGEVEVAVARLVVLDAPLPLVGLPVAAWLHEADQ
jgi:hypothetical protein